MRKLFFLFFFLLGGVRIANASDILDIQLNYRSYIGNTYGKIIAQTFKPFISPYGKIFIDANTICDNMEIHVCEGFNINNSNIETNYNCSGSGNNLVYRQVIENAINWDKYIHLPAYPNMVNTTYFWSLKCDNQISLKSATCGGGLEWSQIYVNGLASGYCYYPNGRAYFSSDGTAQNFAYGNSIASTYYAFDSTEPYVVFDTPIPFKSYKDIGLPMFRVVANTDITAPTTTVWQVGVSYGASSTNLLYYDQTNIGQWQNFQTEIAKTAPLSNNTYYARAEVMENGVIVASTSLITFYINNQTGSEDFLGGITWSNTSSEPNILTNVCRNISTSTIGGMIECSFRRLIAWAFVPDQTTMTDFMDSIDEVKQVFPFNVYFDVSAALTTSFATSTASSTKDSLGIPMIRKTGTTTEYYILPVINSSSMSKTIGSTNTTLFRNSLGWLMWLVAGIYTILRLTR